MYFDPSGHTRVFVNVRADGSRWVPEARGYVNPTTGTIVSRTPEWTNSGSSSNSSSGSGGQSAVESVQNAWIAASRSVVSRTDMSTNTQSDSNTRTNNRSSGISVADISRSRGYSFRFMANFNDTGKSAIVINANRVAFILHEDINFYINAAGRAIYLNIPSSAVISNAPNPKAARVEETENGRVIEMPNPRGGVHRYTEWVDFYVAPNGIAYFFSSVRTLTEGQGHRITDISNPQRFIFVSDKDRPYVFGEDYYISHDDRAFFTHGIPAPGLTGPSGHHITADRSFMIINNVRMNYNEDNNLVELPRSGVGFVTYDTLRWGAPHVIESLLNLGENWVRLHPTVLQIGNLSNRDGEGPGHNSHFDGLSVDMRPVRTDNRVTGSNHWNQITYSQTRTDDLVRMLTSDPNVRRIFFNDPYLVSKYTQVQRLVDHDDHLHIDFNR